jgi:hypothetical protein
VPILAISISPTSIAHHACTSAGHDATPVSTSAASVSHPSSIQTIIIEVVQMQKSSFVRQAIRCVLQGNRLNLQRGGGAAAAAVEPLHLPRLYTTTRPTTRILPQSRLQLPLRLPPCPKSLSRHCSSSASSTLIKIMADRDVLPDVYVLS